MYKIIIICFCYILVLSPAKAHPGIGIVTDSKGNIFYTDLTHVWRISTNGDRSIEVKNVHTHELYLDEDDNLYGDHEWYKGEAIDKWGKYVWRFSKDGVFEKTINDVEGLLENNTLVRDLDGNSYWADKTGDYHILNKQSPNGQNIQLTKHKFKNIRWIYFSKSDQNLYIVDNLKIKKVSLSGTVAVIADNLKDNKLPFEGVADRHYIFGIWTDKNENVFAAVYGSGKVKRIDANGEITTVFKSEEGWSPCGGMIAPDGTIWLMEFSKYNTTRVRSIKTNSKQTIYGG